MPYKDINRIKEYQNSYRENHREINKQYAKEYRENHKEEYKMTRYWTDRALKRRYNINVEYYDSLLKKQENRCAICKKHQSELLRSLSIDHCHKTNTVRGLLCQKCNTAIGMIGDNIELLDRAKEYLLIYSVEKGYMMPQMHKEMHKGSGGDMIMP